MPTPAEEILITNPGEIPLISSIDENTSFLAIKNGIIQRVPDAMMAARYGQGGGGVPQLAAPALSPLTVNGATQLTATWTNVANETGYELQRSTDNINWGNSINVAANDVSEPITGLLGSTLYYVRVRAIGDGVNFLTSNWSNVQSATTQAGGSYQAETLTFEAGLGAVASGWSLTEKDASDALIVTMKSIGWGKFQAAYLFVGSNLAGGYLNLVNPNNSNAAYRLAAVSGTPTMDNGLRTNGAFIRSFFTYSLFNPDSLHAFMAYSGGTAAVSMGVMGGTFGNAGLILAPRYSNSLFLASQGGRQHDAAIGGASGDALISRTAAGNANRFAMRDGVLTTSAIDAGGDVPTSEVHLGGIKKDPAHAPDVDIADHKLLFVCWGTGLTSTEATTLRNAVNTFKTALGR